MWIFYASRNKTIKVKEKKTHEVYDFFTCLLRRSHTDKNKKEGKIFKGSLWPFCLKQVILRPFIQGNFCWLIDKVKKMNQQKEEFQWNFIAINLQIKSQPKLLDKFQNVTFQPK